MVTKGSQNVLDSKRICLIDIVETPKKKKITTKKKLKNK